MILKPLHWSYYNLHFCRHVRFQEDKHHIRASITLKRHFFPALEVAEQKRSSKATWNCGISREIISLMSCFKASTQTFWRSLCSFTLREFHFPSLFLSHHLRSHTPNTHTAETWLLTLRSFVGGKFFFTPDTEAHSSVQEKDKETWSEEPAQLSTIRKTMERTCFIRRWWHKWGDCECWSWPGGRSWSEPGRSTSACVWGEGWVCWGSSPW